MLSAWIVVIIALVGVLTWAFVPGKIGTLGLAIATGAFAAICMHIGGQVHLP